MRVSGLHGYMEVQRPSKGEEKSDVCPEEIWFLSPGPWLPWSVWEDNILSCSAAVPGFCILFLSLSHYRN